MEHEINFGNFIARTHLGTDGVIEVYAGDNVAGDQKVRIKALPPEYSQNPEVVKRFFWEATVAEKLASVDGVVRVLGKGNNSAGSPYYVLPLYEATLESVIQKVDRFPLKDRLRLSRDLLHGLAACHRDDVIHRNIRPASVLIDIGKKTAILSDLGLAKVGDHDLFGAEERTFDDAAYSSPEQGDLKPVDKRSDVFAAGAVIYELLSGRKPFVGETTDAIQLHKLEKPAPPLRRANPQIPPGVEAVVAKALAREPGDRFADAVEMAKSFDGAIAPKPKPKPRRKMPTLDLDIDRDAVARPATGEFDLGERTDAFTRTMMGHKEKHGKAQTIAIIAVIAVIALAVVGFFFRNYAAQKKEAERAHQASIAAEKARKAKQKLDNQKAAIQTAADDLEKAGDLAGAAKKHDEVLALDAKDAVSLSKKKLLEKEMNLVKGMILIPGGRFVSGLTDEDRKLLKKQMRIRNSDMDAAPVHDQYVDAFYLDRREVTNAEYQAFLEANPDRKAPSSKNPDDAEFVWKDGVYPKGKGDSPVVLVTWEDAKAYAAWAGKRLPTGIEWEKAARGEKERYLWSWGNKWDKKKCNTGSAEKYTVVPTGSYPDGASPYGAVDMIGNASEWTADLYETGSKQLAGIAGASFADEKKATPAAFRFSQEIDQRRATTGFRCALTP